MSEKHYPYFGGSFDRIVFDGDGSVWVPEAENAKLRELVQDLREHIESDDGFGPDIGWMLDRMRELGVGVDA